MRTIYLRKDNSNHIRKILVDQAYLATHKKIRLPKIYLEDELYLPFLPDGKDTTKVEKYYLTRDRIESENKDHYFFNFPFKPEQVEDVAD